VTGMDPVEAQISFYAGSIVWEGPVAIQRNYILPGEPIATTCQRESRKYNSPRSTTMLSGLFCPFQKVLNGRDSW
jgi:hypothetical protein